MLSKEECAGDMGQRRDDAAARDAQMVLSKGVCALDMGRRSNYAGVKAVQIRLGKEEFVLDMGQRSNDTIALLMDVKTKPNGAECVGGMGRIATHKMNLLHLDQNSR